MKENLTYLPTEKLEKEQFALLREQLVFLQQSSPYYQSLFSNQAINPSLEFGLQDFKKIPLTSKRVFAENSNLFYATSVQNILDYSTTSGTTGNPLTVGLSKKDLARLAYNEEQTFLAAQVSDKDIVQLMLTLDKQFMAGLAYLSGLQKLGCAVVRSGPGSPAFQFAAIDRHQATVLVAVPSFLLRMIAYAEEHNIDLELLSVKKVICIGESIRNEDLSPNDLAKKINDKWSVKLYGTYASTEMQTAFSECEMQQGGHLIPELLFAEVLDENGNEVEDGEVGELVVTHLGVEGMPLVRYQTGDMVCRFSSPCDCGRNSFRIGPVIARKNQLLKINGTSLYPQAIFNFLKKYDVLDALLLVRENEVLQHQILLLLASDSNEIEFLKPSLFDFLKVKFEVKLVSRNEIQSHRNPESRKPEQIIYL